MEKEIFVVNCFFNVQIVILSLQGKPWHEFEEIMQDLKSMREAEVELIKNGELVPQFALLAA